MTKIEAFLEAAEKATAGPWTVYSAPLREGSRTKVIEVQSPSPDGPVIPWPGFDSCDLPVREKKANAKFIASARNAAPEIAELVTLCRKITGRGRTVSPEDVDRIREIVK